MPGSAGAETTTSGPTIHTVDPADRAMLAQLPWDLPLADWPTDLMGGLPRGISRHIVRFIENGDELLAIKETEDRQALREFDILGVLENLDVPSVEPRAYITGRRTADGQELPGALVTTHLDFSIFTFINC